MKLLLLSDLHLDCHFLWTRPQAARRRRQGLRDALLRAIRLAGEETVDAILVGGDLYEQERFSADTGEFLRLTFERLHPLPIYVAPGNHDWFAPSSLYRQVAWSPNVHIFRESELRPVELNHGLTLWGAAHRAPANTDGFLERFRVDRGGVHLALFHGSEQRLLQFQGEGKVPHAPFRAEQIEASGLHHAFLGHYHCPREADLFTYPGNPEPLSFGEDGERGVVLATIHPDGSVVRKRQRVALTPVHDLTLDITDCTSRQDACEKAAVALAGLHGFARLTIIGEVAPEVDLRPGDIASPDGDLELLVRFGDLCARFDLETIAREPTVRGQFLRDVEAATLEEEEKRRIVMTGLRALDAREDLEVH
jgi:DNA repair exonuclease SbcCD nuclease subunit